MSEYEKPLLLLETSTFLDAGIGCFTATAIRQYSRLNESSAKSTSRIIPEDQIPDVYLKYCPLLESGLYFAPDNFAAMSVLWYINHAKDPNTEFIQGRLSAAKEIEPGEELTMYYPDLLTHPKNKLWVRPEHI